MVVALGMIGMPVHGQLLSAFAGDYAGHSGPVHVMLHLIMRSDGSLSGTLDSPDAHLTGSTISGIHVNGNNLSFSLPPVQGVWTGFLSLFTFEHTQYQIPSAYSAGMIVGLFMSAVGFGVAFAWTRSLIPAIIAHVVFDIPMTPFWQGLLVAALILGALFSWRRSGKSSHERRARRIGYLLQRAQAARLQGLAFVVWSMWVSAWSCSP